MARYARASGGQGYIQHYSGACIAGSVAEPCLPHNTINKVPAVTAKDPPLTAAQTISGSRRCSSVSGQASCGRQKYLGGNLRRRLPCSVSLSPRREKDDIRGILAQHFIRRQGACGFTQGSRTEHSGAQRPLFGIDKRLHLLSDPAIQTQSVHRTAVSQHIHLKNGVTSAA